MLLQTLTYFCDGLRVPGKVIASLILDLSFPVPVPSLPPQHMCPPPPPQEASPSASCPIATCGVGGLLLSSDGDGFQAAHDPPGWLVIADFHRGTRVIFRFLFIYSELSQQSCSRNKPTSHPGEKGLPLFVRVFPFHLTFLSAVWEKLTEDTVGTLGAPVCPELHTAPGGNRGELLGLRYGRCGPCL